MAQLAVVATFVERFQTTSIGTKFNFEQSLLYVIKGYSPNKTSPAVVEVSMPYNQVLIK